MLHVGIACLVVAPSVTLAQPSQADFEILLQNSISSKKSVLAEKTPKMESSAENSSARPKPMQSFQPIRETDSDHEDMTGGWVGVVPNEPDQVHAKNNDSSRDKPVFGTVVIASSPTSTKPAEVRETIPEPAALPEPIALSSPWSPVETESTPAVVLPLIAQNVTEEKEKQEDAKEEQPEAPDQKKVEEPAARKSEEEKPSKTAGTVHEEIRVRPSELPDVQVPKVEEKKAAKTEEKPTEAVADKQDAPKREAGKHEKEPAGIANTSSISKQPVEKKPVEKKPGSEASSPGKSSVQETAPKEQPKSAVKPEAKPEKKAEGKPEAVTETKAETKTPESKPSETVDPDAVGDPHAPTKVKLLYDEIMNGLKARNISGRMAMWQNYARSTLRNTNSLNSGSEIDGRYRLSWYTKLYSDVIRSVIDAEDFSRLMHRKLIGDHRAFAESLTMIREKLDIAPRNDEGVAFSEVGSPRDAIDVITQAVTEAQAGMNRAFATLTLAEQTELSGQLYSIFSGSGCINGHTIPNRSYGRRLCSLIQKMDRTGVHQAAEALAPITNKRLLEQLAKLPENAFDQVMLSGQRVQRIMTSAGDIIIGGREANTYDLDSPDFSDVVCVIDLGGNDTYREGTCTINRPVFVVIDLGGNDQFIASKPGVQGGSILGVSMLLNLGGDDVYRAGDVAQGSTLGGAGILIDYDGNDSYRALRRAQGQALGGVGILVDRAGHDKYHAALWAQGFGAPGGFGVLEDIEGNDAYYCGGLYIDSYPEHPGYDGWGQGIGAGIRQVANGGIGLILDGAGDDDYQYDYFSHGGGYWLGVGVARDFGGNDKRHGTTELAYDGNGRREAKWTRFVQGFGCHYALGFLFDDAGNDYYGGRIMGTGMAWDLSIGWLCDFNGNDIYAATGGMTCGVGAEGSIGIVFDYGGADKYMSRNCGYAGGGISYHSPSNCGGNFSFLIDYGGKDEHGSGAGNNSYAQRGSVGGFLIDRPLEAEAEQERIAREKAEKEQREKMAAEWKALEKAAAEIKTLIDEKKPLTQQQRQTWYRYQQQQRLQQGVEQSSPGGRRIQQRNQGQPIGAVPALGAAPKAVK